MHVHNKGRVQNHNHLYSLMQSYTIALFVKPVMLMLGLYGSFYRQF